ncbi:hypothetical protein [Candidatus Leptofilum sp.]|uniref:hypothetical protein n=1 Tax=Candidatus Leptofilum sp. TaxID=3241576 RepID=UPI003B5A629B
MSRTQYLKQLQIANQYFEDDFDNDETVNYVDKDGLVQFIIASELVGDPDVEKKIVENSEDLIALTSIATAHINKLAADNKNPEMKKDPALWHEVLGYLPLMGPSKLESKTYSRNMEGVEIATSFIEFIMDVVSQQGDALASFRKFLSTQGDAIRFGVEDNDDSYNTVTVCVVSEVLKVGDQIVYLPKIKMYQIHFDRSNWKLTIACASYEKIEVNFDYQETTSLFDYKALEDKEIYEEFRAFISSKRKAQIDKANTFFKGEFEVEHDLTKVLSPIH